MATLLSLRRVALLLVAIFCVVLFLCVSLASVDLPFLRVSPYNELNVSGIAPVRPLRESFAKCASGWDCNNETLGIFSQILVVSRPTRLDRRSTMEQLRLTLDLQWTYIDAVSSEEEVVDRIGQCIRSLRTHQPSRRFQWPPSAEIDELVRTTRGSRLSLTRCDTPFSSSIFTSIAVSRPDRLTAAVDTLSASVPLPSLPLTCAVQDYVHGIDFEPTLPHYMLLTPPKLACWYSHLAAIQHFLGQDQSTESSNGVKDFVRGPVLVLEDDVDMERDIRVRLQEVWDALPDDWDIVFLGHCWSNESYHPALKSMLRSGSSPLVIKSALHPSFAPKCTHAYALSHAGARRTLLHLLFSPFAYSRALDQAFAFLVQSRRLKAFSIVPSIIVQHRKLGSDIDGGKEGLGSGWRDELENGILNT